MGYFDNNYILIRRDFHWKEGSEMVPVMHSTLCEELCYLRLVYSFHACT